jgi:hypothetical protein
MRKAVFGGVALLALAALVWAGNDPWKGKSFDQWTEKDVQAILETSPWAKNHLTPQGAWHPDGMAQMTGPSGMAGSSSDNTKGSAGAQSGQMGGAEKAAAGGPPVYSVWWWSSRTMRSAWLRSLVLKGSLTQDAANQQLAQEPDEYQVLVRSNDMSVFQKRGEKAFESVAYLQMKKNKEKIYPSHVVFNRGSDGESVLGATFFFPKKAANGEATISPDEKEIDFYLQIADAKVYTNFEPRKMTDSKGEDL